MTGKKLTIGLISAAVIGLGAAVIFSSKDKPAEITETVTNNTLQTIPTITKTDSVTTPENPGDYKNGSYSSDGEYVSPGGLEAVGVSLELENGVVKSVQFNGKAEGSDSKRYQSLFAGNYEPKVVGKKIDEVQLDKVSGSSLTSKGFMAALEKIKEQAKI